MSMHIENKLWQPTKEQIDQANITQYQEWLEKNLGLSFADYEQLWQWSTNETEDFWQSIWSYYGVNAEGAARHVLANTTVEDARWFEGTRLNYTEHVFLHRRDGQPALMFASETQALDSWTWTTLHQHVASLAAALKSLGVGRGDRVAAYLPNLPETVAAFLATASLGAIWSCCATEFGVDSAADRFRQIEPKVLFASEGYRYGGRDYDKRADVRQLVDSLPTLEHAILLPSVGNQAVTTQQPQPPTPNSSETNTKLAFSRYETWLLESPPELTYERVPFKHPLWILYSSGTTGLPKPIVQSQGGILLEHVKALLFHMDIRPEDRFLWFTTTGWMMWNFLVGALLLGSTVVLYDGSPVIGDEDQLWPLIEKAKVTAFGTGASYILTCMKRGLVPKNTYSLQSLRAIASTGSPLPPEGFQWIYDAVKTDLWFSPMSGGTDVCTAIVGGCPTLPLYAGKMQCRYLGAAVQAFDEAGLPLVDEVGELVMTKPMPSMPVFFWGDDGSRLHDSYFSTYPGVWRHGDWIEIDALGQVVISGRSDSTINRQGIRMGTSDIYRVVESLPEVEDSLVLDIETEGGQSVMPLFVVLRNEQQLTEDLTRKVRTELRTRLSPRHVPDEVVAVPSIPRTLNGKKMEVPIKKILKGTPPERAVNRDSMSNPDALEPFLAMSERFMRKDNHE